MIPIFVSGTGRSGTTIFRKALSAHPDVATMPGEFRMIVDPDGVLDLQDAFTTKWDPYVTDAAMHRFFRLTQRMTSGHSQSYRAYALDKWVGQAEYQKAVVRLNLDLDVEQVPVRWTGTVDYRNGLMYETYPGSRAGPLRRFVENLYALRNSKATHWVDDTPHGLLHRERIRAIFPDAVFVMCVRHPFDIYSSFLHGGSNWTPKTPKVAAARIRNVLVHVVLSPVVRLEDVLKGPERLRSVAAAVGLADPEGWAEAAQQVYDPAQAHVGRYRTELNPEELRIAHKYLGSMCQMLGYEE